MSLIPKMNGVQGCGRAVLNLFGRGVWYLPGSFAIANIAGPECSLRCVLFHDISDAESTFTKGLGGTISRKDFEAALRFITRHYTPVSLEDVLAQRDGKSLPPRPVLVTFDDAYASVCDFAAPLCAKYGVPAVFFVNASCLDNRQLALDNLVCHITNVYGLEAVTAAARTATGKAVSLHAMTEVFSRFLPTISLSTRERFRSALLHSAGITERALAVQAQLYLSSKQLRDLTNFNFEIGNHTYSHVHCRTLSTEDVAQEIDANKSILEAASGAKVRSFSVPYGSSADLKTELADRLHTSGHKTVFLAEGCANAAGTNQFVLDRVTIAGSTNNALFSEIEVLPRLRRLRNTFLRNQSVWRRKISDLNSYEQPSAPPASREAAEWLPNSKTQIL